ncbi:MAG: YraN family protein [Eubacteriales bacterium]|nr:YraN family protein [Candidatus Hippenecus merdae]MDO4808867.1 YraN family protein [Eubacteriales bacterium]
MAENKRALGSRYEKLAADYLSSQGYDIFCMNFSCRLGEIDIIGMDGSVLCFIEVKYRRDLGGGFPGEAVTYTKQQKIIRTSEYYMMIHKLSAADRRYDVVEILGDQIRLTKNAFGGF